MKIIMVIGLLMTALTAQCQDKIEIANKFFSAYEAMEFDKMGSFWDDSLKFQDLVVAELYQMPATFYGGEKVLKMWKQVFSKKPNYMDIDIIDQFESGDYVVTHLTLGSSISREGKTLISDGEMFTIFKIENGKITEHYDFGDYYKWDRQATSVLEGKHEVQFPKTKNLQIAKEYFKAYSERNMEAMSSYYADEIDFKDLTAKNMFKAYTYELTGKGQVSVFWKGVLVDAKPKYVNVDIEGLFYSGNYVMLSTRYSMILPVAWTGGKDGVYVNIPIKTILQIKEEKIVKHYDFADYNSYNHQIAIQTKGL